VQNRKEGKYKVFAMLTVCAKGADNCQEN